MSAVIVSIFLAVPLALGAWLWWSVRENSTSRRGSAPVPRRVEQAQGRKPSPYTMRDGEVALSFRVGNRYYDETKNRVFECVALKGKKARLVAFSLLDSVEWEKEQMAKYHDTGTFTRCARTAELRRANVVRSGRIDRQRRRKSPPSLSSFDNFEHKREGQQMGKDFDPIHKLGSCGCSVILLLIIAGVIYAALKHGGM